MAQLESQNWNIMFPLTLSMIGICSYLEDKSPEVTLEKTGFADKKLRLPQIQTRFVLSLNQ